MAKIDIFTTIKVFRTPDPKAAHWPSSEHIGAASYLLLPDCQTAGWTDGQSLQDEDGSIARIFALPNITILPIGAEIGFSVLIRTSTSTISRGSWHNGPASSSTAAPRGQSAERQIRRTTCWQIRHLRHSSPLRRLRLPLPTLTLYTSQQFPCRIGMHSLRLLRILGCRTRRKRILSQYNSWWWVGRYGAYDGCWSYLLGLGQDSS